MHGGGPEWLDVEQAAAAENIPRPVIFLFVMF